MNFKPIIVTSFLILWMVLGSSVSAQTESTISGMVSNVDGQPISGTTVFVRYAAPLVGRGIL